MQDSILLVLAWFLASIGFALLALSQKQHWLLLRLAKAQPPIVLRPLGWVICALSLIPAIVRDGVAFGLILWITLLSLAAATVVSWLAWRQLKR